MRGVEAGRAGANDGYAKGASGFSCRAVCILSLGRWEGSRVCYGGVEGSGWKNGMKAIMEAMMETGDISRARR